MPLAAQLETLAALVTAPPGVLAALMLAALGRPRLAVPVPHRVRAIAHASC